MLIIVPLADRTHWATSQPCASGVTGTPGPTVGANISQAPRGRLNPGTDSYRTPPAGWEKAIAKLARERAGELVKLAEELEG